MAARAPLTNFSSSASERISRSSPVFKRRHASHLSSKSASLLNVSFLHFCPKCCLSGHDPSSVVCSVLGHAKSCHSSSCFLWADNGLVSARACVQRPTGESFHKCSKLYFGTLALTVYRGSEAAIFRLMKLRPPHGWPPAWWELGIVTLAPRLHTGSTSSLPMNHINLSSSAQAV